MTDLQNGGIAVLFINKSDRERKITVDISLLGLVSSSKYLVRDLWTFQSSTESYVDGHISRMVASHGPVLLQISKA